MKIVTVGRGSFPRCCPLRRRRRCCCRRHRRHGLGCRRLAAGLARQGRVGWQGSCCCWCHYDDEI